MHGVHYIDIADGRSFVEGITSLDENAKKQNILVISGASSVPCLTAALVDHYKNEFETLESLDYGITTAQKTARGLATTAAILGYTGKPFQTIINDRQATIYGWQGLRVRKYSKQGWKLLSYCDVPDLVLFPKRYPELKTLRFYAGLEIAFVHFALWSCSWLVRFWSNPELCRGWRLYFYAYPIYLIGLALLVARFIWFYLGRVVMA